MNQLANPSLKESFMQIGVEGLFLMHYLTSVRPDLRDGGSDDVSITEDIFVNAMHEGYTYIAQHDDLELVQMALKGQQYGSIGAYDYAYWLFGKWLHEEPAGYVETACKIFPIIMVGLWGSSIGVQSMAKYLAGFYSSRDETYDEFYQARIKLVLQAIPEFIPDRDTILMVEMALAANKFDKSDHTLDDLGELGNNLGLF